VESLEAAFKANIPAYDRSGIARRQKKLTKGVGKAAGKFLRMLQNKQNSS
jgi:hypothetical protein